VSGDNYHSDDSDSKKSETIEIRLPHDKKQAFVEACKVNGHTVSGSLRDAISFYLQQGHFEISSSTAADKCRELKRAQKMIFSGFVAGSITVAVMFLAADELIVDHGPFVGPYFAKLDADRDGRISMPEYVSAVGKSNGNQLLPRASIGNYYLHGAIFKPEMQIMADGKKVQGIKNFEQLCRDAINDIAIAQHSIEHALLDENNDQHLSAKELARSTLVPDIHRVHAEHHLFDKDDDGFVSLEEFQFAFSDDRLLADNAEYSFQQTVKLPSVCNIALGAGAALSLRNAYELHYGSRMAETRATDLFHELDSNKDGRISVEEFVRRIIAKI